MADTRYVPQRTVLASMCFILSLYLYTYYTYKLGHQELLSLLFADKVKVMELIEKPEDLVILQQEVYILFSRPEINNMRKIVNK